MSVVKEQKIMEPLKNTKYKPYTIQWWFNIYNTYSRRAFELSRKYMKTSDAEVLSKYSDCYVMVNWIQKRLCDKYGKFDGHRN